MGSGEVVPMLGKHKRKARHMKRWDDGGVASTVGTVMAIMVILALLSLIINHYVPVWMRDSESGHSELALSQMSTFKTSMDNQILFSEVLYYTGNEFAAVPVYTAVKLGSDGLPVFSSPTNGELGLYTNKGTVSVSSTYSINNSDYGISAITSGNIVHGIPNRYYVAQRFIYENGGIIRHQNDGQVVLADPHFSVTNKTIGGNISYVVSMTEVWLFGEGSASGSGVEGINSKLIGIDFQTYANLTTSIYVNHTTDYGPAWFEFYNATLFEAYEPGSVAYSVAGSTTTSETSYYKIVMTKLATNDYTVRLELKNPGKCISQFKLTTAHIDVTIGRRM